MKVQEFIKGLRDAELCEVVKQIQERQQTGEVQDGIVNIIYRQLQGDMNSVSHEALMIAERLILDEAAARFVKLVENYI